MVGIQDKIFLYKKQVMMMYYLSYKNQKNYNLLKTKIKMNNKMMIIHFIK